MLGHQGACSETLEETFEKRSICYTTSSKHAKLTGKGERVDAQEETTTGLRDRLSYLWQICFS